MLDIIARPHALNFTLTAGEPVTARYIMHCILRMLPLIFRIIATTAVATFLWFLAFGTPLYTAKMSVMPNTESQSSHGVGAALSNLGGLSSLITGGEGSSPNFALYQQMRLSTVVAARLMADPVILDHVFGGQWDSATGTWRAPKTNYLNIRMWVQRALGLPGWSPPTPSDLALYLQTAIKVSEDHQSHEMTFSFDNSDPAYAVHLLDVVHSETEAVLREQMSERTTLKINHLINQASATTVAENRQALVELLADQQRQLMLINPQIPFAAIVIDPPYASHYPTSPRPILDIFIAMMVSGLLSVAFVIWSAMGFPLPSMPTRAQLQKNASNISAGGSR